MQKKLLKFTNSSCTFYTKAQWQNIDSVCNKQHTFIITDANVHKKHKAKFIGRNVIVLKAGEAYKQQNTVDSIIESLLKMGADRSSFLLGVGGGVVTDITGYTASIFMRGIKFGFVPTTILGMVDACIGGKNGVDVGIYKNIVGTINQPQFIFYATEFLQTLPKAQWVNGFAEIIKHAAICNKPIFKQLQKNNLAFYINNNTALEKLISTNISIKTQIVLKDEFEKHERKLLNFGHTLGHAIENTYELLHGQAISIGMVAAAYISEKYGAKNIMEPLHLLLQQYGLSTFAVFDVKKAMKILLHDKKKTAIGIHYILLQKIGQAYIQNIQAEEIEQHLTALVKNK